MCDWEPPLNHTHRDTDKDSKAASEGPSFREAFSVWLRIGLLSFGGPAGQIALMHRMLVEDKGWIDERRFLHALNFCMLLPGPEAQQLATYIGWSLHRTLGGLAAGLLFILPGFVVILALSALYTAYYDLAWVHGLFFGVKAAVVAIVVDALIRIARRALTTPAHRVIAALGFLALFAFTVPFPIVIAAAAILGFIQGSVENGSPNEDQADPPGRAARAVSFRPAVVSFLLWATPVAALWVLLGPDNVFTRQALFFSQIAIVTFGGAYAVLAYVAQQAVDVFAWVSPQEMIDGLGLAETTPGPLIMVVQFVGFLGASRAETGLAPMLAGMIGAVLVTWVTFAPCFLWIFLGAPFVDRLRRARRLTAALSGITAAVVGVIANLALWFSIHVLFREVAAFDMGPVRMVMPDIGTIDPAALGLSIASLWMVLRMKLAVHVVLAIAAGAGVAISLV